MKDIVRIESISDIYNILGCGEPKHPLITIIYNSDIESSTFSLDGKFTTDLYSISLKNGNECGLKYGRKKYDFGAGSMMYISPNQVLEPLSSRDAEGDSEWDGWSIMFHPDLIRNSPLYEKMSEYTFFEYEANEALHLSSDERKMVSDIVASISNEMTNNIDHFSREIIISHLELLLNYSNRFYSRQFITRSHVNKEVYKKFEAMLNAYFEENDLSVIGLPTVAYCADKMGYSRNYLSDLLNKETGLSTQQHIHNQLISRAKDLLMGTNDSVADIAAVLGFQYPQHFSKLFKLKTGKGPSDYRKRHNNENSTI